MSTPALREMGDSPSFPALRGKKKDLFSFHFLSSHDNSVRAHQGMYIRPTNQPSHAQIKVYGPSFQPATSEKSISSGVKVKVHCPKGPERTVLPAGLAMQ